MARYSDFYILQNRLNHLFDEAFSDPFFHTNPFQSSRLLRSQLLGLIDDFDSDYRQQPQAIQAPQQEQPSRHEASQQQATMESAVATKPENGRELVVERFFSPHIDLKETDTAIQIHAELAGIPRENIKIDLHNDILTISGEKSVERDESDPNHRYHRKERRYGKFSRAIRLPPGVDPSAINAAYKDGLLDVTVNKPASAQPKKPVSIALN